MKPNRLINEKSPYLTQHAHNPVDWHPWSEEVFEKAARLDKPVFLSIGYATCHWCHVMEKESFEDEEAAGYINEAFIPVKVDREERPDVDAVYMAVCQMLTGRGGWPLTILMTPDKKPFLPERISPEAAGSDRAALSTSAGRSNISGTRSGQRPWMPPTASPVIWTGPFLCGGRMPWANQSSIRPMK